MLAQRTYLHFFRFPDTVFIFSFFILIDLAFVYLETVTDAERAASTDIGPIAGGLVAALVVIIIVVVVGVVLYRKRYRITGPGKLTK